MKKKKLIITLIITVIVAGAISGSLYFFRQNQKITNEQNTSKADIPIIKESNDI